MFVGHRLVSLEGTNMTRRGQQNPNRSDKNAIKFTATDVWEQEITPRWRCMNRLILIIDQKKQQRVPRRILSSWQRRKSQIRTVPSSEQVANLLSVGEKLDKTRLV